MLSNWANAAASSWEKASRHPWLWHCYPIDTPYIFGTLQQTLWQPQDWWKGKEAVLQSKENVLRFLRPFERMPEWYWISAFLSSFKMMQQVVFSTCDDVFQDKFLQDFPSLWAPDPFSNYRDDSILGRIVISLNSPQLQEMNVKIPPKNPLLLDWIYLHDTESWPRDHLKELEQHQHYLVSSITSAQQRLTTLLPNTSPPAALPWIGLGY